MKKKGNWTLEAIFGVIGITMLLDSIYLKSILPANRLIEGILGLALIILAIILHRK